MVLNFIEGCVFTVTAIVALPFHFLCKAMAFFTYVLYMGFKEGWKKGVDL